MTLRSTTSAVTIDDHDEQDQRRRDGERIEYPAEEERDSIDCHGGTPISAVIPGRAEGASPAIHNH